MCFAVSLKIHNPTHTYSHTPSVPVTKSIILSFQFKLSYTFSSHQTSFSAHLINLKLKSFLYNLLMWHLQPLGKTFFVTASLLFASFYSMLPHHTFLHVTSSFSPSFIPSPLHISFLHLSIVFSLYSEGLNNHPQKPPFVICCNHTHMNMTQCGLIVIQQLKFWADSRVQLQVWIDKNVDFLK